MSSAEDKKEMMERIRLAIVDHVAPTFELDGAGIEVLEYDRGVVQVKLGSVCASCPSSIFTLLTGIEQELRKHVPEVDYLEAVP